MNPETKKILNLKLTEIETKLRQLRGDLDQAERNLKNAERIRDNYKEQIKGLENDKIKIAEDVNKTK
jgi:chromosome segregation ATPase